MKKFFLFIIIFFFIYYNLFSQEDENKEKDKIEIIHSNTLEVTDYLGPDVKILVGEVELYHDSATMYCDSAYYNTKLNKFDAFNNVHIIKLQNEFDTVDIVGTFLFYDGNEKMARLREEVVIHKDSTTLYTDSLDFDMENDVGYYFEGGRTENKKDTLISDYGYYYSKTNELFFKDNVKILNPDYSIFSDTLKHNLKTETTYFFGPSEIIGDSNYIYCEDGLYDHKKNVSQVSKNAYLLNKEHTIFADSLYYNRDESYGEGFNNVIIRDTIQDILLEGNYGIYFEDTEQSLMTDSAVFISISDSDTLYLHGDTLRARVDTLFTSSDTTTYRIIKAYNKVKIYKQDFQAKCDSLVYSMLDSVIEMYYEPVLWAEKNQLSANFITVKIIENEAKRINLIDSSFIISQSDSTNYDQIKGNSMIGYLKNNELYRFDIQEKIFVIYFVQDNGFLMAINKIECDSMKIMLDSQKVDIIYPYSNPKGGMYPPVELAETQRFLPGFRWWKEYRPTNKFEIFIWRKED